MKKLNLVTVLSITAGLAFAWNAMAADEQYGIRYNKVSFPESTTWLSNQPASECFFTAVANESVLKLSIERNNTEHGFIFGTYALDADGNPILGTDHKPITTLLGTVTQNGEVGMNGVTKIAIDPANPDYDYNVESVYSDAFAPEKLVGIWMQEINADGDPTGMIYYSQNQVALDYNNPSDIPDLNGKDRLFTQGKLDGVGPIASVWFDDGVPDMLNGNDSGWPGEDNDPIKTPTAPEAFVKIHLEGAASGYAGKVGPKMGGPLPGVWATIALAGAAGTYLRRRKNK